MFDAGQRSKMRSDVQLSLRMCVSVIAAIIRIQLMAYHLEHAILLS